MNWFWIALAAPALWGMVNHVDKFIISRYFSGKGVGALVIFTSLSGLIASVFILLFNSDALSLGAKSAIIIAFNGALLVASYIPYLHALEKEDASVITALFQLIPVFSYFLGLIFLGENLTTAQIIASSLIIAGAVIISLDISSNIKLKVKPLLFMVLSAFMLSVNALIFKIIAVEENFWGTAFWEYLGSFSFGLILFLFVRLYRRQFIATVQKGKAAVLSLNVFAELLNVCAKLLANFASLLAPLALVWVVNGFQPMLVFIYGLLLTLFIPQWGKEKIEQKVLVQKIFSIILIFTGVYFLLK